MNVASISKQMTLEEEIVYLQNKLDSLVTEVEELSDLVILIRNELSKLKNKDAV